jgi:phenylacetate-coenzyme A ligase PaaK-like adenylate-forming protein
VTPQAARVKDLVAQLEKSQWLPPERMAQAQLARLAPLLRHAHATTAFYPVHWGKAFDGKSAALERLPVLRRRDLQERYDDIRSRAVPAAHGKTAEGRTSGSSGMPVRVQKTELTGIYWRAFTLREHLWHRRDFSGKLAVIRRRAGDKSSGNWGSATLGLVATGPAVGFEPSAPLDAQLDWLAREDPAYLLTYPSLAGELARRALARGLRLPSLKGVRTLGELLPPETREACREAWGVGVTDSYSCEELGYLALQCPEREHYHVQSEAVILEVLDDAGRPCMAGSVGRVVATALHNYATPLVRYELGDYAEVGESCGCGRGLPVLRRIVGRTRNMFVTASGERFWPSFGSRSLSEVAPIVQHQFVQKAHDLVEARLVTGSPLSAGQEEALRQRILRQLPAGVRVEFSYPARIERSAGGKFEDFKSELAT